MSKRRLAAACVLSVTLLAGARVAAEPIHLQTPSEVNTDGGSTIRLPAGYFLDEELWAKLDLEVKRLQDAETRLRAENESLTASGAWGWGTVALVATALAAGAAGGWWLAER